MRLEKSELKFKKSDFWDYSEFLKKKSKIREILTKSQRFEKKGQILRRLLKFFFRNLQKLTQNSHKKVNILKKVQFLRKKNKILTKK